MKESTHTLMISNTNATVNRILKEELKVPGDINITKQAILPSQALDFVNLIGIFIQDVISLVKAILDVGLKFFGQIDDNVDIWALHSERSSEIEKSYNEVLGNIGGGKNANIFTALTMPGTYASVTGIRNIHGFITKGEKLSSPFFNMDGKQRSSYYDRGITDKLQAWWRDRKVARPIGRLSPTGMDEKEKSVVAFFREKIFGNK